MQKTKFLILISILLLAFSFNSFAQTDSSKIDLEGKWALQFGISRNFTLSDFQGGTISGKYHFTNNSALRFGVTLGYEAKDSEASTTEVRHDTTITNNYSGEKSSKTIQIALQYLYYLEMNNSISAYGGVGVNYIYTPRTDELKGYRLEERNNFGYGIDLLVGTEWFVRSNIGLHAEYGVGFGYSYKESTYKRKSSHYKDKDEMNAMYFKASGFSLYNNYVKFGLSIYF